LAIVAATSIEMKAAGEVSHAEIPTDGAASGAVAIEVAIAFARVVEPLVKSNESPRRSPAPG